MFSESFYNTPPSKYCSLLYLSNVRRCDMGRGDCGLRGKLQGYLVDVFRCQVC